MTRCRVLLVDDVADLRFLLRVVLETDGAFEVVGEAGDGARAVELAERARPDVVVLDLSMPTMDGLEALPMLRAAAPGARIVVLSGFEGARIAASTAELGADAYLEKGTPPTEVLDTIKMLLGIADDAQPASGTVTVARDELAALMAKAIRARSTDPSLLAMADDVLVLDEIAAGTVEVAADALSPAALLVDLEPALRELAGDHDLEVTVDPELSVLRGDRRRIGHILANLVRNAERFAPPATPIGIAAHADGAWVAFEVVDAGPGVPAADRMRVLGERVRLARDPRGLGLGLFVATTLARAMGGSLRIGEREQAGTRVVCRLPVAEPSG